MKHSKKPSSSLQFILFIALGVLSSCGVKPRVGGADPVSSPGGSNELPQGVSVTKNRMYLVRSSVDHLIGGEENLVAYNIVDSALNPVGGANTTVQVIYHMPEMPGMGDFTAIGVFASAGLVEVLYEIPHGGNWETKLVLKKDGVAVDEITYYYNVAGK